MFTPLKNITLINFGLILRFKLILVIPTFFFIGSSSLLAQIPDAQYHEEFQSLETENNDSIYIEKAIKISRDIHKRKHDEQNEYFFANLAINKALLSENGDILMHARALDNLGLLYRYHTRYNQAYPLHIKAYELVKAMDIPPINKMIFANNAGIAARYDEQYDLAVSYYLKAYKIATEENDLKNIGISSNGLGNALSSIPERRAEALEYFEIGLDAERQREEDLGIAMNLLSISKYYINIKDFSKAFEHLEELKSINTKRADRFGIAITTEAYGDAYMAQNKAETAKIYYLEALRLYKNYDHHLSAAQVLNRLGDIQMTYRNYDKAIEYYNQSLEIADSMKHKSLILTNAFDIATAKEKVGQLADALRFYKLGKSYEDSIDLDDQRIKIAALKNEFDWEQTETKINLLQREQDLKQKEIESQSIKLKNQKLLTGILLMGILLFIGFGLTQYRLRKIKLKAQNQLIEKEKSLLQAEYERNMAQAEILISRMQINPHFIFNCLNAINLLIQKEDNKTAGQYLTNFSRFIRMVLEMPKNETIKLEEELQLIQYYLKLEEKRFDDKLDYQLEIDEAVDLDQIMIPPLLLQPFVENAIWHGLLPSNNEHKELKIRVYKKGHSTKIAIEDNGVGIKDKQLQLKNHNKSKKSLGTKITKERIKQFNQSYNDCTIKLSIQNRENTRGTQVLLTIENDNN